MVSDSAAQASILGHDLAVSMTWRTLMTCLAVGALAACGGGDDDAADDAPDAMARVDAGVPSGACDPASHVGGFGVELRSAGFTAVEGQVKDAITPFLVLDVVDTDGECQFLRPPQLFCDPPCIGDQTCGASGACVPVARALSVGTLTFTGLKNPVTIEPNGINFYTNIGPLEHPGFDEGDSIRMTASGSEDVEPFGMSVLGVKPLASTATSVTLAEDVPLVVEWTPGSSQEVATMHIDLNIALHGGTPGSIECEVSDTGSFQLPVSLTNQLLAQGFSGFPALVLTRHSVDSESIAQGCVQLEASSKITFAVEIDGLISCSGPDDCPDGQDCLEDLTCG